MTPQEQNMAIGKALGWNSGCPPDYARDLNAIHEAVNNGLPSDGSWRLFIWWLEHLKKIGHIEDGCVQRDTVTEMLLIQSTAAQRAEAFLRTLNLWKE